MLVQRGKLARCSAGDLFDALLVGGEEAAAGAAGKPDARIFHKAARLAGVQPCEVPCFSRFALNNSHRRMSDQVAGGAVCCML